jgi:hypothetical protein
VAGYDLTISVHETERRKWAKVTVWGVAGGKYGSQEVGTVELDRDLDLDDLEAVLVRTLAAVHSIVVHS